MDGFSTYLPRLVRPVFPPIMPRGSPYEAAWACAAAPALLPPTAQTEETLRERMIRRGTGLAQAAVAYTHRTPPTGTSFVPDLPRERVCFWADVVLNDRPRWDTLLPKPRR